MKVYILASGSKGNMTYLKVGHIKLFVDAGISYRRMRLKMEAYDEDMQDVPYLLLTHEHHDHVMGLKMLLKQQIIKKIFLTQGTLDGLHDDVKPLLPEVEIIKSEKMFDLEGVHVTPFVVSHDANEPVGYVIDGDKKLVFIYDTGYLDEAYYNLVSAADIYIVEANHHPTMLMQSPRPFLLKKRILSEKGHLSNDDASWLVNKLIKQQAIWVVSHISEDCNSILAIEESIVKNFDDPTKVEMYYAMKEGLPGIDV
jgi:phosphoribosyl 1,2-cyclic phosphodiesterase